MIRSALILICLLAARTAHASDPGGGASSGGANVALSATSTTATLSNGVITAVIQKSSGKVSSYLFNGTQMVDPANPIYYSMDGGANYEQPSGCVYSVTTQTPDMVDVSFKRTWDSTSGYKHIFDIEVHYVLRRGDTGLYAYAILDHPAAYPAASVGEWRIVWKLPRTSTTFTFERTYIDDLRHWEMPSYYDYQNSSPTGISEIVKLNTGVMAGKYDGKYTYSARYSEIGTWGHASNIAKKGVWFVLGGHDYFNDGPTKQDLTSSESYILMHFGRNHYEGSGTSVAEGEAWRKMYGPFLLYCNGTTATSNAGDALWADAKAQVEAEKTAWPYAWLATPDHPAASSRGTVTGRLLVNDPLRPAITGANANIGLAAAEDTNGNWQSQGKGYQYWARADASGNFTLPAVRPGSYTLYAFTDGVVGEFSKAAITVTAGGTNVQGDITWNVIHPGTSIAWEIGVPDRTAKEFKHGNDYFTPYLWDVYPQELPNPLEYTVGSSNSATDWNYVHSNYPGATAGTVTGWDWNVNFNLPVVPRAGNATLTVAVASSESARLFLYLNDEVTSFTRISPPVYGGNTLLRQGIHAKYSFVDIPIPVSRLRQGANTFRFSCSGDAGYTSHVMYDYLRFELPDYPPPPPDSGRSIVWAGGSNAAANTWDSGTTNSFRLNSSATPFGDGDTVTFGGTGSNSTSITLTGALQPNSVTFGGTKNYTLAGSGDLSGLMSLTKTGSSTLTISQANTYSGLTSVNGGVIALSNDTANSNGFGTSDVVLQSSTLRMYSNSSSSNSSYWNIDVPSASISTLETDWRCDLYGKLTGSGTFRYKLPSGAVRSLIFGNWSAFSGTIEATAISGSADFRMASDYSWPGLPSAVLSLGNNITALWSGNLNSGAGTFVNIGELSGTATSTLKGGSIGGRQFTYRIGGRGGDSTFAGTISEQTNGITHIVKQGGGTWTLSGTSSTNGDLTVESGTLLLSGTFSQIAGKSCNVGDAAIFVLDGTLNSGNLHVLDGGSLQGQGNLSGNLVNDGLVDISTGNLDINGSVTNNGYFRVRNPATFAATGTFTNTGVLNLIESTQAIPAGIVNTGVILTDRSVTSLTWSGAANSTWDIQNAVNWTNLSSQPDVYFSGDAVLFDDSAVTSSVELVGTFSPASVTVTTAQVYSFNGGTLAGTAGLVKNGTGELHLATAMNLTGSVVVNGGALHVSNAAAWPAGSPLVEVKASATIDVSDLAGGAVIATGKTFAGAGAVAGNLTVNGIHDPGPGASVTGALAYGSASHVSWSLAANSNTVGAFDSVSAASASVAPGAVMDLIFNAVGGTVDFSQPFWSATRTWTVLSATSLTGSFALGTVSADSAGHPAANYGGFTFASVGTTVVLTWTPVIPVAKWRGTAGANWDLSSTNWDILDTAAAYQNGIATRFDDGGLVTAVNVAEAVSPGVIDFVSSLNHSIGGAGTIGGAASLVKNGTGTLTLTSANTFTGGTTINFGSLAITNASALGTGAVTLNGGRWETGTLTPNNPVVVTSDSTISGGGSGGSHGIKAISGSGILTLEANNVFDLEGSMTSFNGTVRISGSNNVRFNGSLGSATATFDLGARSLQARNGGTYNIGSITGQAESFLSVTGTTSAVTFSIGANGASSTFAGAITNGSGTAAVTKTGSGSLTLAGSNAYTGLTTVSAGSLVVSGSLGATAVTVNNGATFGVPVNLTVSALTMQASATLAPTLAVSENVLQVNGNVALAGTLQVTLPPGTVFGRFPVLAHTGTRTGTLALAGVPSGLPSQLVYGFKEVVLHVDDFDQDGLADTWEQVHFGSLVRNAAEDPDGDGQTNAIEFATGTLPDNGASLFAATAASVGPDLISLSWPSVPGKIYRIESSSAPAGPWISLMNVPAAASPSTTTTRMMDTPPISSSLFYRIALDP